MYKIGDFEFEIETVCRDRFNNELPAEETDIYIECETDTESLGIKTRCEIIQDKEPYAERRTFAMINAVTLKIKPYNNAAKVTGGRYLLLQKNDCWVSRFTADKLTDIPNRTASVLWERDGKYYSMLPLCDENTKSEICGKGDYIEINISPYMGGFTKLYSCNVVISFGDSPYKTINKNAEYGFEILGLKRALRTDKRLPEMFDYLGFCSWNAFYKDVTANGLFEKAEEFKNKDIPVKWFLIDDGWFGFDGFYLTDIHADKDKFPDGLKACADVLKQQYGLKWVGAWQCFLGYWSGVKENSKAANELSSYLDKTNGGYIIPSTDSGKCFEFWNKWNEYLHNEDIDFVKVDVQNSLEGYSYGNISAPRAAKHCHNAMEASCGLYFDGAVINCTGMGHESLWNRPAGAINRNSADFDPNRPETMRGFIVDNIFNSLYHSCFYYLDWDMLWSYGKTEKLNTVLRAVGGGPVYVSDEVGKSNYEVLSAFADDAGRLLKCDCMAMPSEKCLFEDVLNDDVLLKAWNIADESGVLAGFNVSKTGHTIVSEISVTDIDGMPEGRYTMYDRYNNKVIILDKNERYKVELDNMDCGLYIFSPFTDGLAVIGVIDKYIPGKAIKNKRNFDNRFICESITCGTFAYCCDNKHRVLINNHEVKPIKADGYLCCNVNKKDIIEIIK